METYEDVLRRITGGRAPEEGDLNTARLIASDTPPPVLREIMAELQTVDHCVGDEEGYDEMFGGDDLDDIELSHDEPEVDYLWAICGCEWQGSGMYWEGDNQDFQRAKKEVLSSHQLEKPDCTEEPTIG